MDATEQINSVDLVWLLQCTTRKIIVDCSISGSTVGSLEQERFQRAPDPTLVLLAALSRLRSSDGKHPLSEFMHLARCDVFVVDVE